MPPTLCVEAVTLEISDKLLCLFNAEVTVKDDKYVVEVPRTEVEAGSVNPSEVYRVALISKGGGERSSETESTSTSASSTDTSGSSEPQPPVEQGEVRYVEIEDIGKQGDGIARVERGYVIIVPDAEIGERVKVEVTEVKSNFAVGEIIDEEF